MNRHKHGFNDSKTYCQETCPDVDKAFSDAMTDLEPMIAPNLLDEFKSLIDMLCESVKEVGTTKLRDALCSACNDKLDAESERDSLQRQVDYLQNENSELRSEIREMES